MSNRYQPELSIKIYAIAGPYANLKLYSRLDADLLQTPWWKLYGGITMNAGAKVEILDKFLLEYTVSDLLNYELLLAQATTPPVSLPIVTTNLIASITQTTATGGGNVTSDGNSTVTVRGVCWSTSQNPTTSNNVTTNGSGTSIFTSSITGLTTNTTYYVRAYATNSVGTAYGTQVSFTTSAVAPVVPTITTTAVSSITNTTATSGGNISSDGGAAVTAKGVCWSTSQNPTTSNSKTTDGTGTGSFTSSITGLTAGTTYYARAYATNSAGTSYGSQVSFATTNTITYGSVSDVDGNSYSTVTIGTQEWMAENLKTTKYNDGTTIPLVTDGAAWKALSTPGYCWYNNDAATYKGTYGALYNWYTVNTGKLCPTGWHVPGDAEWTTLTTYLGGGTVAGGKLKETGTSHWSSPNTGATNSSGFTALPGGNRDDAFYYIGREGHWWSSTEYLTSLALSWFMAYHSSAYGGGGDGRRAGKSVRCLRD